MTTQRNVEFSENANNWRIVNVLINGEDKGIAIRCADSRYLVTQGSNVQSFKSYDAAKEWVLDRLMLNDLRS